ELAGGVVLDLAIGLDLALQLDQLLGALVDFAQAVQADRADRDQQRGDGQECRQELGLHTGGHPRDEVDERRQDPHYRSSARLTRSRRNSSGSKRTPRYCTRRMPRRSTIEVRNVWSTPPSGALAANTP